MAKNWVKCAKSGHGPAEEGWNDSPQQRADGALFVTHICSVCHVLYVERLGKAAVSEIVGARGEALVK